jgi:hypothetical protein
MGPVPRRPAVCPLCGRGPTHLDHDHATGRIRGWLCRSCNLALGLMAEDPVLLRRLADWIEAS